MKKLVSALILVSVATSACAWMDASINQYQASAIYEAHNKANTNAAKKSHRDSSGHNAGGAMDG